MVTPDPVDVRLLSLIAEVGRAAVHEVAARMGMDPREVASRLVALSANGLPLVVGVECDPNGIRATLAALQQPPPPNPAGYPSGQYQVQGTPSGQYQVQGTPSGVYPANPNQTGPYPYAPQPATPSGQYQVQGTPSGRYPGHAPPQQYQAPPQGPPPSQPIPMPAPVPAQPLAQPPAQPLAHPQMVQPQMVQPPTPADPVMSTWGPPQSSSWARGDQPPAQPAVQVQQRPAPPRQTGPRSGKVGETLEAQGLDGEFLAIQLVEVVDPADFLFTAAGYRLQEGERSVVLHTELVNKGTQPFNSLPDLYLVLLTKDGQAISKAPVSLSSRPPHRIGVAPGETAGGHAVYVLPEDIEVTAVRWSTRPDDLSRALTWAVEL